MTGKRAGRGDGPTVSPNRAIVFATIVLLSILALTILWQIMDDPRHDDIEELLSNAPLVDMASGLADAPKPPAEEWLTNREVLRVAIAPVISPEESLNLYDGLVSLIAEQLGREPVLLQRSSYAEINSLLRHGYCDIAFVCSYAFVEGERDFKLTALAVPVIEGRTTYNSYIIVPVESTAQSLLDLKGMRFASADILSNSGWLYPKCWLQRHNQDPDNFFSEHLFSGSHDRSLRAVATGIVDGAAVDSIVYHYMLDDDPSLGEKIRIVTKSPPFGMPPIAANPDLDAAFRQRIIEVLLDLHKTEEGRKALQPLRIDHFIRPRKGLYDSVRQAANGTDCRE